MKLVALTDLFIYVPDEMNCDELQDLVKLVVLTDLVYLSIYIVPNAIKCDKLPDLVELVVLTVLVYLSI